MHHAIRPRNPTAIDGSSPLMPADPLGEALHLLRMDGAFYCRSELTAPWGITMPPMPGHLWFHAVTAGAVHIDTDHAEPVHLSPGDIALVPHGEGHCLRSGPGVDAPGILDLSREPVSQRYEVLRHGGGGAATTLICGAVRFDDPAARTLVGILPGIIHVEAAASARAAWMRGAFDLMAAEAERFRPGGEAVITRLADILVIQTVRHWIDTDPQAQTGWLGALQHRQIGHALALIHRDPARPWTVASLARATTMSRSAFAARFTELVGEPAMQYVTRWRMQLAQHRLAHDGATVAELAPQLGYQSQAAFARAFKRVTGMPPGAAKRAPAGTPSIGSLTTGSMDAA